MRGPADRAAAGNAAAGPAAVGDRRVAGAAAPGTADLVSPGNGAPLRSCGPGLLSDGERRWPVVAGIPWLRTGREELRRRAVRRMEEGDPDGAALVLLADSDDWWDGPAPSPGALRAALGAGTLREAVGLLGMGRVGAYFLHRWSDPTWLAVLALTARHSPAGLPVLELACGAGHLLRELRLRGHRDVTGIDVVFAKLWLARRFVVPRARLVCADVTAPWPLRSPGRPAYVACHDALYFLPRKEEVVRRALAYAAGGGVVLGHCHNSLVPGPVLGLPLSPAGWCALLPGAVCYDDADLTRAALTGALPRPRAAGALTGCEAMALVSVPPPPPGYGPLSPERPVPGRPLRPNPLYHDGLLHWPGERWREEYGPGARAYLPDRVGLSRALLADAAVGRLTPEVADLARHRVLLDLPERW
ncbi:class I SAM-dependent methyltransferase [Streptomyces sp. TG1A-8]|uniref:class I SAM-dependent methyltransferase n=1 Tax=Streptomyces sp. TG1A-8 TaxID=3051385 RepID=UPI00265C6AC2|nr:class I SAM-dependent methyltransferase [Streptomyces sp. TG1A-8]MDO0929378.1 class I SAM-dependent methyltransferase [Streptomyces sp. TG1A-8]